MVLDILITSERVVIHIAVNALQLQHVFVSVRLHEVFRTLDVKQTLVLERFCARGRDRGVTGGREEDTWSRYGLGSENQIRWRSRCREVFLRTEEPSCTEGLSRPGGLAAGWMSLLS